MKLSGKITGSLFKKKESRCWWASVYCNGKRYRFSCKTQDKSIANKILTEVLYRLYQGEDIFRQSKGQGEQTENVSGELTLEEFFRKHYLPYCEGTNRRPEAKIYIFNSFPVWLKQMKLKNISLVHIERLQSEVLKRGRTPATANKYLTVIKHMMHKACDWEAIPDSQYFKLNRCKPLKGERQRTRFLTQEEFWRLYEQANSELKPILIFAVNTGARLSEILNLKWEDVNIKTGYITFQKTKNGYPRTIPMNQTVRQLLIQLTAKRRLDVPYVFYNPKTAKKWVDIGRAFDYAKKRAGLGKDVVFHTLRHTFCSWLAMSGANLRTIQQLSGHRDFRMVLRYSHLSDDYTKQAISKLDETFSHSLVTVDQKR